MDQGIQWKQICLMDLSIEIELNAAMFYLDQQVGTWNFYEVAMATTYTLLGHFMWHYVYWMYLQYVVAHDML